MLLATLAFAASRPVYALDVSGPITSDTVWEASQSPYRVTADIAIENGATLRIEPGVIVRIESGANLSVNVGALQARGTPVLPIVFTAASDGAVTPTPGSWGALRFADGTIDTLTVLEHVQVRYGQGVLIESAAPTLNELTITNNSGPAIRADLNSSPRGTGLRASGNGINGVLVPAGDITSSVSWGLVGIPYVVEQGAVSVGQSPAITAVAPNEIAQGETIDVLLSGTRLGGLEALSFINTRLTVTMLSGATPTSIPVRLIAAADATLGPVRVEAQLEAGKISLENGLSVVPPRPPVIVEIYATPNPLALPPDNVARQFFLRLSQAQPVDRSFAISVRDAAIAIVSPTIVNFAPGETVAAVAITGRAAGQTILDVTSSSLPAPAEFPIYVTTSYAQMNFAHGKVVGVIRGDGTAAPVSTPGNPIGSKPVGIVRGDSTQPLNAVSGNPVASTVIGIIRGDPTVPLASTAGNPVASTVIGIVKGDATTPLDASSGNPVVSTVIGITRGDATLPLVSTPGGPVTSVIVGIEK